MVFNVLLHPRAAKELERIDNPARSRMTERLKELKNDPETAGKALKHTDFWSLRVGDYRAVYEIHTAKKQVIVLFIGHRKKVYDNFSKLL